MELKEYILNNGYTLRKFAEMLDITPVYLSACITGRFKMGPKVIKKVMSLTNGQVSNDEIVSKIKRCPHCGCRCTSRKIMPKK